MHLGHDLNGWKRVKTHEKLQRRNLKEMYYFISDPTAALTYSSIESNETKIKESKAQS